MTGLFMMGLRHPDQAYEESAHRRNHETERRQSTLNVRQVHALLTAAIEAGQGNRKVFRMSTEGGLTHAIPVTGCFPSEK